MPTLCVAIFTRHMTILHYIKRPSKTFLYFLIFKKQTKVEKKLIFTAAEKVSPKMSYYSTDHLTFYMYICITDNHEGLEKGDEMCVNKEMIESMVYYNNRHDLKDYCKTYLEDVSDNLMAALLNTIDLDRLNDLLKEWLADLDNDETDEE